MYRTFSEPGGVIRTQNGLVRQTNADRRLYRVQVGPVDKETAFLFGATCRSEQHSIFLSLE